MIAQVKPINSKFYSIQSRLDEISRFSESENNNIKSDIINNSVNHVNKNLKINDSSEKSEHTFENFQFSPYPSKKIFSIRNTISNLNSNLSSGRNKIFRLAKFNSKNTKKDTPCSYLKENLQILLGSANLLQDIIKNNCSNIGVNISYKTEDSHGKQ